MILRDFKNLGRGVAFLNLPGFVNLLLVLGALPVVLRSLDADLYGKLQFVLALQVWLFTFGAPNITYGAKRGIARGLRGTLLYAFSKQWQLLVGVGLLFLVGFSFMYLRGDVVLSFLLLIMGLYAVFGYLFEVSLSEFFVAEKKFGERALWQIVSSVVAVGGSTVIAYSTHDVVWYALFLFGSMTVVSWVGCARVVFRYDLFSSYRDGQIDKSVLPYGIKLLPSDLILAGAERAAHFLVGAFFGFFELAIFSVAHSLRDQGMEVMKSIRPLLYADFAKTERKELGLLLRGKLFKITLGGMLFAFLLLTGGWIYTDILLPHSYQGAKWYLSVLAFGIPAIAPSLVLHTMLESHLRYKELTFVRILAAFIKVGLIVLFGYFWGMWGIVTGLALSSWGLFLLYYFVTFRRDLARRVVSRFPFVERLFSSF